MREDIYRFVYKQEKLKGQMNKKGMVRLRTEDLDPYPGVFLKDNLRDMIFKSNQMLSMKYLQEGDIKGSQECQRNIFLAEGDALPCFNPFEKLIELQKLWGKLMASIEEVMKKENIRENMLCPINR